MNYRTIRKFLVALSGALAASATALADGQIDQVEGIGIALVFLAALGVYRIPNEV